MKQQIHTGRKSNKRELNSSRFRKVTFPGGDKDIIKEINVDYENDLDLVVIKFEDIKSRITRENLIKLSGIYNIEWQKITRYPVYERFGYIIEGVLQTGKPVTFIRKELKNRGSGRTELWFSRGYFISAPKIIRAHELFNKKIEYWGTSIKRETLEEWALLTSNKTVLLSYDLSQFVYGNINKREQTWKYSDEIIEWIISIVRKIDREDRLKLLTAIQQIEFERL